MNPLNRKMFRDPRAAKRATGILASSAPLMTAAQKAMMQGQPMRAQTGASVDLRGAFRDDLLSRLARGSVQNQISQAVSGVKPPPLLSSRREREANRAAQEQAIIDTLSQNIGSSFQTRPPLGSAAFFAPKMALSQVATGSNVVAPPTAPVGPGEQVAAGQGQNPGYTPTAGASGDTGELSSKDALLIAAQGSGSSAATEAAKDLLTETQEAGGKVSAPTITPSTVTLPSGFNDTDAPSTGTETTTGQTKPEDALPDSLKSKVSPGKGVSATQETAEQNDKDLGISPVGPDGKPLTYKQRVEARFEVLKDLLGEDRAKDIRSDKNYNLMMLGLRIAAGQDPNALSNIAAGAGQQLQEFGEVSGEESQRRAAKVENLVMLAASDVSEQMKAEAAQEFARTEREQTQLFQAGQAKEGREFQFDMNMFDKNFASLESSLARQHARAMRVLGEEYQNIRAKNAADLQIAIRNADSQDKINMLVATHEFQADMAANGQVFDLEKLMIQQEFAKEQGVDDRTFRAKLAMMPPDTQRLYERYLTDEQAVMALTSKKTGNDNDRAKDRGMFIRTVTTNVESRAAMEDALKAEGVPPEKMEKAIAERASQIYDQHVWPVAN